MTQKKIWYFSIPIDRRGIHTCTIRNGNFLRATSQMYENMVDIWYEHDANFKGDETQEERHVLIVRSGDTTPEGYVHLDTLVVDEVPYHIYSDAPKPKNVLPESPPEQNSGNFCPFPLCEFTIKAGYGIGELFRGEVGSMDGVLALMDKFGDVPSLKRGQMLNRLAQSGSLRTAGTNDGEHYTLTITVKYE